MKCDLHIHSNCSDGIFSPEQIVEMAKEKGLDCIAVTDHDTVLGVRRAMEKGKELGVKVLVGVEISTVSSCGDVHILAYNLETDSPDFAEKMSEISNFRTQRNSQMQKKFDENGIARLELTAADGRALYMTVEKGAGHFVSSTDYIPVHQTD